MSKKRIAVDQDNVIADLLTEWVRRYNLDYNDNLKPQDINSWNWHHLTKPECQEKLYTYMDDPELFLNLPVMEDSQEVLEEMNKQFDIYIVTAPFNINNAKPKYDWLSMHFPFLDPDKFVFTRDKSIIAADYLIDDKPKNLESFGGGKVLFDAPHNRLETGYFRVHNWQDLRKYFLKEHLAFNTFDKVRIVETEYTKQFLPKEIGEPAWILKQTEGEFDYMVHLNNKEIVLLTEQDIEKY